MEEIKDTIIIETKPKKVKEEPVEEIVSLKRSEFDAMLKRIERVEAVADKSRLQRIDEMNRTTPKKQVGLSTFNNKLVIGWGEMTKNICEKDIVAGGYVENLKTILEYSDGTKEEVDYTLWQRNRKRVLTEVISESRNKQGKTVFEVEVDGVKYEIVETFINS